MTGERVRKSWRSRSDAARRAASGPQAALARPPRKTSIKARCSATKEESMKLLLYFSDAFAWQYLQETEFMPGFWDERRPLETVLGYSSTILPCLVTGEPPQRTGIWTEYFRRDRHQ